MLHRYTTGGCPGAWVSAGMLITRTGLVLIYITTMRVANTKPHSKEKSKSENHRGVNAVQVPNLDGTNNP